MQHTLVQAFSLCRNSETAGMAWTWSRTLVRRFERRLRCKARTLKGCGGANAIFAPMLLTV